MRRLFRTPRTALTWATLDEWLGCAWRIERRRPSALRNRQAMLHVRALPLDTSSAAGELVFRVFGAMAHFERRPIAERTKDGIAAARDRGKQPGRRPLDADKIAAALKLAQAGLSPTAAAKQVGLGRSTVYRELGRAGIERASNFST
jgi:DNA invertase Pin-like site-specific DNA recombinase